MLRIMRLKVGYGESLAPEGEPGTGGVGRLDLDFHSLRTLTTILSDPTIKVVPGSSSDVFLEPFLGPQS